MNEVPLEWLAVLRRPPTVDTRLPKRLEWRAWVRRKEDGSSEEVSELRNERDRIDQAIASLQHRSVWRPAGPVGSTKRTSGITAGGRRRSSEAMKRRWAERRVKGGKAITSPASKSTRKRGGMTLAGRKRLSEMMKSVGPSAARKPLNKRIQVSDG